jgi:hypothetical protein
MEFAQRVMKPGHPFIFASQDALGEALLRQDRLVEAEAMLRESLEIQDRFAPGTWRHAQTQSRLGAVMVGLKRFEEAETLLLAGFETLQSLKDKIPARDRIVIAEAENRVSQLYSEWNQPEKAQAWRERAAIAQAAVGP